MEGAAPFESWLAEVGFAPERTVVLTGDVSTRRYLRLVLTGGRTAILALYPVAIRGTCQRFLATTRLLEGIAVRVPAILAAEVRQGWMVLEDLGPRTLFDLADRPWAELVPYFEEAAAVACRIAGLSARAVAHLNPPLDAARLAAELDQTWESFLAPRRLIGDRPLARALGSALRTLCQRLGEVPPVPCHRDFMARNLVPLPEGGLAILDHQDLRLGPPAYDLASLLNDSLFPPPEVEERILAAALPAAGGRAAYRRAVVQRALKAIGTFATFAQRGHERHLPLIPPTLARALAHLPHLPETADLAADLGDLWRPVAAASLVD